ncbi:MAG TPA: sulfite exporter TauE/SafE family protein [Cyclobacteriaceae bacterium]|nr:sulfite exporter TauE/SafE family protein [Cyclobacteriaceae bacterium]
MRERVLRLFRRNPDVITGNLEYNKYSLLLPVGILLSVMVLFLVLQFFPIYEGRSLSFTELLTSPFFIAMMGGFVAQLIDGALGMAYGVSATTILTSLGLSQAATSASVHTSEIFTSGVSGWFHLRFGNVNKKLVKTLVIPGVIGAILGAYVLSSLSEYSDYIKPIVAVYTFYLGLKIILKVFVNYSTKKPIKRIGALAAVGGFLDSIGGGGWGPIVSSTLISRGRNPVYTIGSVNLTEFFVSLASAFTFSLFLNIQTYWQVILGLILGGVAAAPFAAILPKKLPVKKLFLLVGTIVIILSVRNFVTSSIW